MLKTLSVLGGALALSAALMTPAHATDDNPEPETYPRCESGAFMAGTSGNDRLIGTDGNDVVSGRAGNDVVRGDDCHDLLYGGRGNDRLRGTDGYVDRLGGGRGYDICIGDDVDSFFRCEVVLIRSPFPKG